MDLQSHAFALEDGVSDAHLEGSTAAHEGSAGWGAGRADLEVGETGRFFVELVDVGSSDHFVTHAGKVAHALVIGDDHDDIGARAFER